MVFFFAEKLQPWKTKLNKLLFYADFIYFGETGYSISWMSYAAIDMGPVPNNFNSLFGFLAGKGVVEISAIPFSDGTGEQFKPYTGRTYKKELFSENEIQVLEEVANRFKNTSTSEIIELSHNEAAWKENKDEKKLIEY